MLLIVSSFCLSASVVWFYTIFSALINCVIKFHTYCSFSWWIAADTRSHTPPPRHHSPRYNYSPSFWPRAEFVSGISCNC
jgi:hypothetical protein